MNQKRYLVAGYLTPSESPGVINNSAVLGHCESIEDAEKLRLNGLTAGWNVVKIIDTDSETWVDSGDLSAE